LGVKGKPAEEVAKDAVNALKREMDHGGCTDAYMQDQLILYVALAEGTSRILTGPLTPHTHTAIHFASLLTGATFRTSSQQGTTTTLLECDGVGLLPSSSKLCEKQ